MAGEQDVIRCVCRAERVSEQADVNALVNAVHNLSGQDGLLTLSLFQWREAFFVYAESVGQAMDADGLLGNPEGCLKPWPGGEGERFWVPMMDIFHYSKPQSVAHWRRKASVETPYARVIRLRPEKVSSYIFYHYQLQEERPGMGDKYGLITIHEDLLFFYQEQPRVSEESPAKPSLETSNTPPNWGALMSQHFAPWPDPGEPEWRPISLLASVGLPG